MRVLGSAAAAAAILISAGATGQAPDATWIQVSRHAGGPIFIDPASVRRDGNYATVVSRTDLEQALDDGTRTLVVRYRYDCVNRTSDLLYLEQLAGDGRVLLRTEIAPQEREIEAIPADSPNAAILARVCT
jgi:hypothetical protein